jgi:hypothetical protein
MDQGEREIKSQKGDDEKGREPFERPWRSALQPDAPFFYTTTAANYKPELDS